MKLILRLVENQRCESCGAIGHIEERARLCLYCCAVRLKVEDRARKQRETIEGRAAVRFRSLLSEVAGKLRAFGQATGQLGQADPKASRRKKLTGVYNRR